MAVSRKQKQRKQDRTMIARLTRKYQIAALELLICVLQQQLNRLNVEEFGEDFDSSLEIMFVVGQKLRVLCGRCRKRELCEVINMTPKGVWV